MNKYKRVLIIVAFLSLITLGLNVNANDRIEPEKGISELTQEEIEFYEEALFALCDPFEYLSGPECCETVGCCTSFGCIGPYHEQFGNNFDN